MHRIVRFSFLLAATAAWAAPFTGPQGTLYLTNSTLGRIYVINGTLATSFGETYSPGFSESVIAVSGANEIQTRSYYSLDTGHGGQYTFGGTPTGVNYGNPNPAGLTADFAYDGTTDGFNNYFVEDFGVTPSNSHTENVYRTDTNWQNPVVLFSVQTNPGVSQGEFRGISYDQFNNSLWVSGWNDNVIRDYAMDGTLLSSFVPSGSFSNVALAFDPHDHTLWTIGGLTNVLYQYDTNGNLLQSGTPAGLPTGQYLGGEFVDPIPEPATWTAMLSGIGMLAGFRRRLSIRK